jgi:hypothetical protein
LAAAVLTLAVTVGLYVLDALNSSGLVSRSFSKPRPSGKVMLMVILDARGPLGLT